MIGNVRAEANWQGVGEDVPLHKALEPTEREKKMEVIRRRLEETGMASIRDLERLINPQKKTEAERTTSKDVEEAFLKSLREDAIRKHREGQLSKEALEDINKYGTKPGYFGPDTGNLPPYAVQWGDTDVHGSKQLHDDLFQVVWNQIIEPPIDLRLWASQIMRNTRLMRAIRTLARNVVGLGWEIVSAAPIHKDTTDEERAAIKKQLEIAREFFDNCNSTLPFSSVFELETMDEEACGNGYLEWVRTNGGQIEKVFHVPAITMRLLRNERGYVQIRGTRRRYFKKFGDERVMDSETGAFVPQEEDGPLPLDKRASEIQHFAIYTPTSEFYGIPRWLPAAAAVTGNVLAAKRNLVFFKNDAVPRTVVAIQGGASLTKESKDELQRYFDEGKGAEAAHRMLVLQTSLEGVGVDEKSNVKIDLKPLTVGVGEDASFLKYRKANDEEIREALGLSEVFFTSGNLAKASAVIAKAMTDEQELEPMRRLKEHLINHKVIKEGLGLRLVKFRFLRPQMMDTIERARADMEYAKVGVLTPNEIRQRSLGMDPYPASMGWGHQPLPKAQQEQALKLALIQNSQNIGALAGDALQQAIAAAFGQDATTDDEDPPHTYDPDARPGASSEGGGDPDGDGKDEGFGKKKNKGKGGGRGRRGLPAGRYQPNDTGQNENDREQFEEAPSKR